MPSVEAQGIAVQLTAVLPSQFVAWPHLPARLGEKSQHNICVILFRQLPSRLGVLSTTKDLNLPYATQKKDLRVQLHYVDKATCVTRQQRRVDDLPHAGAAALSAVALSAWPQWPPELA